MKRLQEDLDDVLHAARLLNAQPAAKPDREANDPKRDYKRHHDLVGDGMMPFGDVETQGAGNGIEYVFVQ
jgi:hypothetical protein